MGAGHGLKVVRAPIGSDYSVEPENDFLDDAGQEILLEVSTSHIIFYIEVKATVRNFVRMTEAQGKKATANSTRYALCVVSLTQPEEEISMATVPEKCMFVFNIGSQIKPLVDALESIKASKNEAIKASDRDIELEMENQIAKFKVGREVWEAGLRFNDAVRMFGGLK